jgi:hypothetical protein
MWGLCVLVILNIVLIPKSKSEEEVGAEYLKSVMSKLQSEREEPPVLWNNINQDHTAYTIPEQHDIAEKIMGPTPLPVVGLKFLEQL